MRNHNLGNQSGEKGEMQDKYVGDIGDFGKYGLLRALFGRPEEPGSGCGLSLAVAWYFNEDQGDGPGGKYIDYLRKPSAKNENLRKCDPVLYNILRRLVRPGNRKVTEVEQNRILPADTLYNKEPLSGSMRTKWFKGALEATRGAEVVFVDPDNGIASENTPVGSPKHVLPYELERFYERGQSLIIYHHLARTNARTLIKSLCKQLQEWLAPPREPWALWYHRGTARVYFIVPRDEHKIELGKRLKVFEDSPWVKEGHFQRVI